jgi:uncharacterized protein YxjI
MPPSNQEEQIDMTRNDGRLEHWGGKRYRLCQKIVSIGRNFWIENEEGEQVYKIDGSAVRLRRTYTFKDAHGKTLAKIVKSVLTLKESMEVSGPGGEQLAVVKKDLFTPLKEHFIVNIKNGPDLEIHGNLFDHEYTIGDNQYQVAQVSKKWLDVRDSYSVLIEPDQDDVILLAVVVCIDEMTHATR